MMAAHPLLLISINPELLVERQKGTLDEGVKWWDKWITSATGGPYRFVRHPGYLGTIVASLATPFLLGSWWALIPSAALAALFVLRTALEDRTLQAELPGYADFTRQTCYCLLPGVW